MDGHMDSHEGVKCRSACHRRGYGKGNYMGMRVQMLASARGSLGPEKRNQLRLLRTQFAA